jgi:hypothetical protein
MSVVLLIVFISVSYLIVRIGSIALEMTGMERSRARFQALSAFSGTGFTTREAELVVTHPRRRKIVTYLMILGNAGIVSVIATFVVSLRQTGAFRPSFNLLIIAASIFVLYRVASYQKFAKRLTTKTREFLREKLHFERVQVQELLMQAEGFGVAAVLVGKDSRVVGLTLAESGFRDWDLMVLSIERDDEVIPVPKAQNKIRPGDRLICYGKLENLQNLVEKEKGKPTGPVPSDPGEAEKA